MRKYFYLITEHPEEEKVGLVEETGSRKHQGSKGEETPDHRARIDRETGEIEERYTVQVVSLGHADFEGEDDYEERGHEVMLSKLGEIPEKHLEKAGHDPAEVLA